MNSRVNGSTELYGVIGHPISHSLSPEIHNTIFDLRHENRIYLPISIPPHGLKDSIVMLRNSFKGFNVTIPHKETIMEHLDEIEEKARWYGAVNTVKVNNGKMTGYNTDGYGFTRSLQAEGISLKGKRILLIGAGGAARIAAHEILLQGGLLTIANRSGDRAHRLKEVLKTNLKMENIEVLDLNQVTASFDCIINATPLGMAPREGEMPVREDVLRNAPWIFDMVYNPYETKLLKIGKMYGCGVKNGFSMLFYQAVKAQEIWTGKTLMEGELHMLYKEIEDYVVRNRRRSIGSAREIT
jgi:shikimate dehydrogenase